MTICFFITTALVDLAEIETHTDVSSPGAPSSVGCRLSPRSYLSPHILVSVDLQDLTLASLETSTFLLQAAINKNAYLDCFLSAQEVEKVMSSFIYHPPVRNNVRHSISSDTHQSVLDFLIQE